MNQILNKLKKLRGRGLDELRVRGAQQFAAYTERRGWSEQARVPSDAACFALLDPAQTKHSIVNSENLLDHFRARTSPQFFGAFSDRSETIAEVKERWPEAKRQLIEQAGRIGEGRFDLLGLRNLFFGDPIDWHLEPLSGKRSPLVHWSAIEEIDAGETGDKKIVWELNRQQYFITLGRAYWLTGDEHYAEIFVAHVESWMDRNPPKLGLNWISSLEVAFRSISWLWAFYFFKGSPRLTPQIFLRLLKYLYLHARHLETYLSTYSSPNTHLTGEALGLFYLGTLLPEFRCAQRWREAAQRILLAELDRHVRPDGVYFEQTSYYHRYTADFYTHFYLLAKANGERVDNVVMEKLTLLLDHLLYITRPDGTTPFFGDDDGGKLLKFDARPANDFRPALSNGAALFARGDYKYVAGNVAQETLWLLGRRGLEIFDQLEARPPAETSRAFKDGGYFVMRDGWRRESNYLLIDCGPHGTLNCGHAHADALAFDLSANGRTLLVDPGTYSYTGSSAQRDLFRTSAAHNTLIVDEESSSQPGGPFSWKTIARSSLRAWKSHARFDYFEGAHDGYLRLNSPVSHLRSILFLKDDYWIMRDQIETKGTHRYDLHFHFTPDAHPTIDEDADGMDAVRENPSELHGIEMFAFGDSSAAWHEAAGWVSSCYAERTSAPVFTFSAQGTGAQDFITFLLPHWPQAEKSSIREIKAARGRAFEMRCSGRRDMLLLGGGCLTEALHLETDCSWTWLRMAPDGVTPEQLILIDGTRLLLDGQELLNAKERIEYTVVQRDAQAGWRVETEMKSWHVPARDASQKNVDSILETAK